MNLDDIDPLEILANQWLNIGDVVDLFKLGCSSLRSALADLYDMLERGEIEKVKNILKEFKEADE